MTLITDIAGKKFQCYQETLKCVLYETALGRNLSMLKLCSTIEKNINFVMTAYVPCKVISETNNCYATTLKSNGLQAINISDKL